MAVKLTPPAKAFACRDTVKQLFSSLSRRSLSALSFSALSILFLTAAPDSVLSCNCSEVKVPDTAPADISHTEGYKWSSTPECQKEFHDAVEQAKTFCEDYQKKHPGQKLAIVSDIDETVLDNRPCLKDFSHDDWGKFFRWVDEAKAPKLKESSDFLQWARDKGYCIFFITGRHEKDRAATIINLNKDGFAYDGLYCREKDDKRLAEVYKTEVRENIEKMGFVIVENIGDQYSDLVGGHSIDCQKLPNRMYFIK